MIPIGLLVCTFFSSLSLCLAHISHLVVFDKEVRSIPKGYRYFAIAFSPMVAFFELRKKKTRQALQRFEKHT